MKRSTICAPGVFLVSLLISTASSLSITKEEAAAADIGRDGSPPYNVAFGFGLFPEIVERVASGRADSKERQETEERIRAFNNKRWRASFKRWLDVAQETDFPGYSNHKLTAVGGWRVNWICLGLAAEYWNKYGSLTGITADSRFLSIKQAGRTNTAFGVMNGFGSNRLIEFNNYVERLREAVNQRMLSEQ